jgi:hypothetical protein
VTAHAAHLEIDVRFDDDGIRGEVCLGTGPPQPFSGWLGLISTLDELINENAVEESK